MSNITMFSDIKDIEGDQIPSHVNWIIYSQQNVC